MSPIHNSVLISKTRLFILLIKKGKISLEISGISAARMRVTQRLLISYFYCYYCFSV